MAYGSSSSLREVSHAVAGTTQQIGFDDSQRLRKKSRAIRHACRKTRSVSVLLRSLAQRNRLNLST
jgi:hypothetical protein